MCMADSKGEKPAESRPPPNEDPDGLARPAPGHCGGH